jgi:hypothetical protein
MIREELAKKTDYISNNCNSSISIITPTYNSAKTLASCLDSDNILPSRDWLSPMKNFEKVLSKEGDMKYPLYVIKGRNPL